MTPILDDTTQLHIPVSDNLTSLNGLIAVFVNKWSGSKTKEVYVNNSLSVNQPLFPFMRCNELSQKLDCVTTLPFLVLRAQEELSQLTVAGLAAVCRHIIRHAGKSEASIAKALGFRHNCLQVRNLVPPFLESICSIKFKVCPVHMLRL